jgi:hypothetical protein
MAAFITGGAYQGVYVSEIDCWEQYVKTAQVAIE